MKNEILKLKKEKNAIILAHCYQNVEIDEVADFVGDSFFLSKQAANTNADIIIFAGVSFMAQTAKILSPNKRVFLPNTNSDCMMANMIDVEKLRKFKKEHANMPVVCYVNSTAEVKAECDICCTSSNAIKVVKSLGSKEIMFVPDTYLGKWVEAQVKDIKIHTFSGFCPIHLQIKAEDMLLARKKYPNAPILVHPECHQEVTELADFVGSTTEIMKHALERPEKRIIIGTDKGVVDRLQRDCKDKEFILIKESVCCENMKRNTLENIYNVLKNETNEVIVEPELSKRALGCLDRMLEACK